MISTDRLSALEAELEVRTREVAEQQHFMATVIDSLPVGLYVVDREYRVRAWNHTRETGLQGIARGEALGRTIFEILHRQSAESLRREFDEVFATGTLRQFETESTSNGAPRTYRVSKIPMRVSDRANGTGAVTHVITVGEDVTAWKEAEGRAAHAEKLAAIGQLAAGVMHEMNNPLATIAACAESIATQLSERAGGDTNPQHLEYLRVIQDEVDRCKGIVGGVLDFSRARPQDIALVDVVAVTEQALALLQHHAQFKRLEIQREYDGMHEAGRGIAVRGNAERLLQVVIALLVNASDAIGESGTVIVRARRDTRRGSEWVVVEISDTGTGIPRSDLRKIFEPFYTTKPVGKGTGLGLSICYGIVADHGGRLDVESTVGVGSTFRVALPVARAEAA